MTLLDDRNRLGLKHRDFKPCILCGHGVMHAGNVTFFKINLARFIVDMREVQRAQGMELMLGSALLANVMGPDNDLAKQVDAYDVLICEPCAVGPIKEDGTSVFSVYEKASDAKERGPA